MASKDSIIPCICTDNAHQNRCMSSHFDGLCNQRLRPTVGGTTTRLLEQLLVTSSIALACDPSTITILPNAPTSRCIILESEDMRHQPKAIPHSVCTLLAHVFIRFVSFANTELGTPRHHNAEEPRDLQFDAIRLLGCSRIFALSKRHGWWSAIEAATSLAR